MPGYSLGVYMFILLTCVSVVPWFHFIIRHKLPGSSLGVYVYFPHVVPWFHFIIRLELPGFSLGVHTSQMWFHGFIS